MRRPLLISALIAIALCVTLISLGLTVWSGPQAQPSDQPAGPALGAAVQARGALATRLGLPIDEITTESVKAHTWKDTSLGLPEPGMMYAQVLTEGYVVTLVADGTTYVYHIAGEMVKPADPADLASAPPAARPDDPAERARADLAARLGVSAGEITVASVEEHTWPDASLGLPEPGMMYAQVLTDGYVVTLSHTGDTYVYHVAGETAKLNPAGH